MAEGRRNECWPPVTSGQVLSCLYNVYRWWLLMAPLSGIRIGGYHLVRYHGRWESLTGLMGMKEDGMSYGISFEDTELSLCIPPPSWTCVCCGCVSSRYRNSYSAVGLNRQTANTRLLQETHLWMKYPLNIRTTAICSPPCLKGPHPLCFHRIILHNQPSASYLHLSSQANATGIMSGTPDDTNK